MTHLLWIFANILWVNEAIEYAALKQKYELVIDWYILIASDNHCRWDCSSNWCSHKINTNDIVCVFFFSLYRIVSGRRFNVTTWNGVCIDAYIVASVSLQLYWVTQRLVRSLSAYALALDMQIFHHSALMLLWIKHETMWIGARWADAPQNRVRQSHELVYYTRFNLSTTIYWNCFINNLRIVPCSYTELYRRLYAMNALQTVLH